MKNKLRLSGAFFFLCMFPFYLSSQTLDLTWFDSHEFENGRRFGIAQAENVDFFKTPNGAVFRYFDDYTTIDDIRGLYLFIQKIDDSLEVVKEFVYGLKTIAPNAKLCEVFFTDEVITILSCYFDKRSKEAVFGKVLIDPAQFEVVSEFEVITRIEVKGWMPNYPTSFPITVRKSPDHQYAVVSVEGYVDGNSGRLFSASDKECQFILDSNMNIIYEEEEKSLVGICFGKDETLYWVDNGSELPAIYSMGLDNGEKASIELVEEHLWFPWSGYQQAPYFYTFERDKKEGVFGLLDPESMSEPIYVNLTEEHFRFFDFYDFQSIGYLSTQRILDVFRNDAGNYIVTTEYNNISTGVPAPATSNTSRNPHDLHTVAPRYSSPSKVVMGNIASFCISPEGNILWIQSILKRQQTSSISRVSAVFFRTESGIHFIYNDAEGNLSLESGEGPLPVMGSNLRNRILAHSSISNEGELAQEILYKFSDDDYMWLNVPFCYQKSDSEIILRMRTSSKEKLGILTIREED